MASTPTLKEQKKALLNTLGSTRNSLNNNLNQLIPQQKTSAPSPNNTLNLNFQTTKLHPYLIPITLLTLGVTTYYLSKSTKKQPHKTSNSLKKKALQFTLAHTLKPLIIQFATFQLKKQFFPENPTQLIPPTATKSATLSTPSTPL